MGRGKILKVYRDKDRNAHKKFSVFVGSSSSPCNLYSRIGNPHRSTTFESKDARSPLCDKHTVIEGKNNNTVVLYLWYWESIFISYIIYCFTNLSLYIPTWAKVILCLLFSYCVLFSALVFKVSGIVLTLKVGRLYQRLTVWNTVTVERLLQFS